MFDQFGKGRIQPLFGKFFAYLLEIGEENILFVFEVDVMLRNPVFT